MIVRELTISEYDASVSRLAGILVDAVDSGAGVTFMHPLAQDVAEAYWMKQKADVASGQTTLFVAEENGVIGGTVMLQKVWPPNQPHRCEVAKLLVRRDFRRRGLATLLMQALEAKANGPKSGRSFLPATGLHLRRLHSELRLCQGQAGRHGPVLQTAVTTPP